MLARLGQQSEFTTNPFENVTPCPTSSRRTFGIAASVSQRWSSVRTSTMLGRASACAAAPGAARPASATRSARTRTKERQNVTDPGAPPSNTRRPLARDHATPEPTPAPAKAPSLRCGRVRPLAWCSRRKSSAALLEGALMPQFQVSGAYSPTGDQPDAIAALSRSLDEGNRFQALLGATGTGKTATMAWIIEQIERPALVI